jgi:hypothetical protein
VALIELFGRKKGNSGIKKVEGGVFGNIIFTNGFK